MLYTVSAVQILVTIDALDALDRPGQGGGAKVGGCECVFCRWNGRASDKMTDIARLQDPETGAFAGDEWGEMDTRFLYGALNALSLLRLLHLVDVPKSVAHVQACANFDGGYGVSPSAESHAGQVFTCLAALSIAGRLDLVDRDRVGGWLSERQLENGGLNGRPEKLEDVCYSWWVASSLAMIDRLHWIDAKELSAFILRCQASLSVILFVDQFSRTAGFGEWWTCRSTRRYGRCLPYSLWTGWLESLEVSWPPRNRPCIVSVRRC